MKGLPEEYLGIRKIFRERSFQRGIFQVLISKNLKFACVSKFLKNVKNGFVLILWLKKGGWSYTRRGLIRGILRYIGQ